MIDIDHFKKFNDTYGHQAGDEVLQFVAKKFQTCKTGTTYRYGGEEFCIIFNGKNGEQIISEVDTIRRNIEGSSLILSNAKNPKKKGKRVSVTISAGVASSSQFISNPADVIKLSDGALYRAKKKGRNRVEIEKRKTLR
jgi:diguanylate cyclase (GGDEF)-like protein